MKPEQKKKHKEYLIKKIYEMREELNKEIHAQTNDIRFVADQGLQDKLRLRHLKIGMFVNIIDTLIEENTKLGGL